MSMARSEEIKHRSTPGKLTWEPEIRLRPDQETAANHEFNLAPAKIQG